VVPLAAVKDLVGNFFDGEVRKIGLATKGGTEHQQATVCTNLLSQLGQLVVAEVLGGDVDKISLGGVTLLPVEGVARGIGRGEFIRPGRSKSLLHSLR